MREFNPNIVLALRSPAIKKWNSNPVATKPNFKLNLQVKGKKMNS